MVCRGGSGANGSCGSGGAGGGTLTPTLANFTLVTFPHFAVLETVAQICPHLDADLGAGVAHRQAAVDLARLRPLERHAEERSLRGRGAGERRDSADRDEARAHWRAVTSS
jgi:hypothetical protein